MRRAVSVFIVSLLLGGAWPSVAWATSFKFTTIDVPGSITFVTETTFGGHTYQLWDESGISWQSAQANATGLGGYLAVLTDFAETTAVYDALIGNGFFQPRIGSEVQAWLGATPADGSSSTLDPNNWAWVTGEAWTAFDASNFAPFEPNGDSEGLAINRFGNFQWNDEGSTLVGGYIVEINRRVPEPGTLALLGLGLLGLGLSSHDLRARGSERRSALVSGAE